MNVIEFSYDKVQKIEKKIRYDSIIVGDNYKFKFKKGYRKLDLNYDIENLFVSKRKSINIKNKNVCLKDKSGINFNTAFVIDKLNSNSKVFFQKNYLLNKTFNNELYIENKNLFLFNNDNSKNINSRNNTIFSKIYDKKIFYYTIQDTSRKVPFGTINQEDTVLSRELNKINYDDIESLRREINKILIFDVINLKINSTRKILESNFLSSYINDKTMTLSDSDINVHNTSKTLNQLNLEYWLDNSNKEILKKDNCMNINIITKNIYEDNTHNGINIRSPKILLNKYFENISKEICKINILENINVKYGKVYIYKYINSNFLSKSKNNLKIYNNIYLKKPMPNTHVYSNYITKKESKILKSQSESEFLYKNVFDIFLDNEYKLLSNIDRSFYINKYIQIKNKDYVKSVYTLNNAFISKWNPNIHYCDGLFLYKKIDSLKKMNCFNGIFKYSIYVDNCISEIFLKQSNANIFKNAKINLSSNNKLLNKDNKTLLLQTNINKINAFDNKFYNKKVKNINIYKYDNFYSKYINNLSLNKDDLSLHKYNNKLTLDLFTCFLYKKNKNINISYFDKWFKKKYNYLYLHDESLLNFDVKNNNLFINNIIFANGNFKKTSSSFNDVFLKNKYKNMKLKIDNLFIDSVMCKIYLYDNIFVNNKLKYLYVQRDTSMISKLRHKVRVNTSNIFAIKKYRDIYINNTAKSFSKIRKKSNIYSSNILISKNNRIANIYNDDTLLNKSKNNICNFTYEEFLDKTNLDTYINSKIVFVNKQSKNINRIFNNDLFMKKGSKNVYKIDTNVSAKGKDKDVLINTFNIFTNKSYKTIEISKDNIFANKFFKKIYIAYEYTEFSKKRKELLLTYEDVLLNKNKKNLGILYVNTFAHKSNNDIGILYNNIFSNKKCKNTSILYVNTFINKKHKNTGILNNYCFVSDKYISTFCNNKIYNINKFAKDIKVDNDNFGVYKNNKSIGEELFNLYVDKSLIKISSEHYQILLQKYSKKINKIKINCMADINNKIINDLTLNSLGINKNYNEINELKKDDYFIDVFPKDITFNNNITASNNNRRSMIQYRNNDTSSIIKNSMIQYNNGFIDKTKRDVTIQYNNLFVEVIHFNDEKRPEFKLSGNIDELLMPYKDYDYKVFDLINDDGTINFKYVKRFDSNTGEYIIKSPIEHPIPLYSNIARKYIDLDTGILEQCIYYCKERWNKMMFKYSAMSAKDSIFDILKYMKENIDFNFSSNSSIYEQALRCLQLFRWYGEMAILNNCEYALKFLTEDLKTDYADLTLGEMEEYITLDNFKISDSSYTIEPIDKSKKAILKIYCPENDNKNKVFSKILIRSYDCNFTAYKDNEASEAIRYPDVTGWNYEAIQVQIEKELLIEYIPQNNDSCIYISDIELRGVKLKTFDLTYKGVFGESNKVLNDMMERIFVFGEIPDRIKEELCDVYPVTVAVDKLQQYFELHHKDKLKGKRLITKK